MNWSYRCPSRALNVSASLCWEQHQHLCIPLLNSTLEKKDGNALVQTEAVLRVVTGYLNCFYLMHFSVEQDFNTLNVDRHPKMCVQVSINQMWAQKLINLSFIILIIYLLSYSFLYTAAPESLVFSGTVSQLHCTDTKYACFHCLTFFSSGLALTEVTSWEASVEAGRRSIWVLLTSSVPAKFSAQLCVLTEGGCTPAGAVHSLTVVCIETQDETKKHTYCGDK